MSIETKTYIFSDVKMKNHSFLFYDYSKMYTIKLSRALINRLIIYFSRQKNVYKIVSVPEGGIRL